MRRPTGEGSRIIPRDPVGIHPSKEVDAIKIGRRRVRLTFLPRSTNLNTILTPRGEGLDGRARRGT